MKRLILGLALVAVSVPVHAQQLKLAIKDGRVTLDATAIPARLILSEWARVGGTKVVGSEKLAGPALTLKFVDMPERQALDLILRNAAGFMAAPRSASSAPGASAYDRILVLAATSAPPSAAGANAAGRNGANVFAPAGVAGRRTPPRPPNLPPSPADDDSDVVMVDEDPSDTGVQQQQPVFTFPQPPGANQNINQPVFMPVPNNPAFGRPGQPGYVAPPVLTLQPNANGQPTIYNFVPNSDGTMQPQTPQPSGFTIIGSPTPGLIQQPTPTPVPQRPPGQ
jgi:hypothetical protein